MIDEYTAELVAGFQRVLPILLLGPGIALVIAGLFMWLGGLRWRKAVAAFAAAVAGLIGAYLLTDRQLLPLVLVPVVLAGLGLYFDRLIVVLLGALIVAGVIFIGPTVADIYSESPDSETAAVEQEPLGLLESVDFIEELAGKLKQTMKTIIANISPMQKTAAVIAAAIFMVIGIVSWRFACASTCATIGVAEIAAGATLILLYKGAETLRQVAEYHLLIIGAAGGLILIGAAVQMRLCPAKPIKLDIAKELLDEEKQK